MIKKISYFLFKVILLIDNILKFITNKSFIGYFKDFIHENSYTKIIILNNKISFYTPNQLTEWRVKTFFTKEPETLEWIDGFQKEKFIFWDIGANIGLYSIYNALKNINSETISFEPSSSNLRVLSRNVSINNLNKNIKLLPVALTNHDNSFLLMNEREFVEGGALNTFGENFNYKGENFEPRMSYKTLGMSINYLIENKILEVPDYIKIDVDGIEHLILQGADKYLDNKKLKSLSIEINEDFKAQYNSVLEIMKKNNFRILHKKRNESVLSKSKEFANTYNYIFVR